MSVVEQLSLMVKNPAFLKKGFVNVDDALLEVEQRGILTWE